MKNNILIVGAGITGITLAQKFASYGYQVLIIEKRNHIGGNCYDFKNKEGFLIHKYGPHIFNTDYKEVWDYLCQFTEWIYYKHEVLGFIDGKFIPIPFNLNSLYKLFPTSAEFLEKKLIEYYGLNKKIPILEFKKTRDKDLKILADFIYNKIYLNYSLKQWGQVPENIDPSVTGRVPIFLSRDNRYFQKKYQGIPKEGYTNMFRKMLKNKNIKIKLNTDYNKIREKINSFDLIFYTGRIDEFFNYKFGKLNYRCLRIRTKMVNKKSYQPSAVVNYPDLKYSFTRITEFKKITYNNVKKNKTIVSFEYPGERGFLAWPLLDKKNKKIFKKYLYETKKLGKNIHFVGRLAEYKYYNMDESIKKAIDLFNKIIHQKNKNDEK